MPDGGEPPIPFAFEKLLVYQIPSEQHAQLKVGLEEIAHVLLGLINRETARAVPS